MKTQQDIDQTAKKAAADLVSDLWEFLPGMEAEEAVFHYINVLTPVVAGFVRVQQAENLRGYGLIKRCWILAAQVQEICLFATLPPLQAISFRSIIVRKLLSTQPESFGETWINFSWFSACWVGASRLETCKN